jgi:hypothetical protein
MYMYRDSFREIDNPLIVVYTTSMSNSPSTQIDKDITSAISKRDLQNRMPEALAVLDEALASTDIKLAVATAKYVIDQSVGKATQEINNTGGGSNALAEAAAGALKKLLESHPALQDGVVIEDLPVISVEGRVVEIGDPDQE